MTEIYGTLGPSCASADELEKMLRNGMTGIRLNLSHVTIEQAAPMIENLREAEARCGVQAKLLVDMQGPELRIPYPKPRQHVVGHVAGLHHLLRPTIPPESLTIRDNLACPIAADAWNLLQLRGICHIHIDNGAHGVLLHPGKTVCLGPERLCMAKSRNVRRSRIPDRRGRR